MSWSGLAGTGVSVSDSPYETARFGRSFSRVVVGADAPESVGEELRTAVDRIDSDIIVVRYPTHLSRLGAVLASTDRRVLPADTLTYWEVPAAGADADDDDGLEVVIPSLATDETLEVLRAVIRDSFSGYGNHYTANPELDPELALAGYVEWAERAYAADPHHVVLLNHGGVTVGLATLTANETDLEIELAGMTAASQGHGWYGSLLRGVRREAVRRGLRRVIISTQVSNVRVQRAWVRAGFKPFAAVNTCHLVH